MSIQYFSEVPHAFYSLMVPGTSSERRLEGTINGLESGEADENLDESPTLSVFFRSALGNVLAMSLVTIQSSVKDRMRGRVCGFTYMLRRVAAGRSTV